jgi:hypothetical protein
VHVLVPRAAPQPHEAPVREELHRRPRRPPGGGWWCGGAATGDDRRAVAWRGLGRGWNGTGRLRLGRHAEAEAGLFKFWAMEA